MIKADLQLVMRMFLGSRMNERIENDARISKYNCGSRSGYSIENALLEKRLIMDHAKKSGEDMVRLLFSSIQFTLELQGREVVSHMVLRNTRINALSLLFLLRMMNT